MSSITPQFVINLGSVVLSDADSTTRIPIAKIGTFYKEKQKFSITRADIATMADNFAKRGNGEVVIDYEHASEFPELAQGGPIPAAGWIVGIDPEPDKKGIVWAQARFTDRARDLIAAGEYKYGSPSINWGARDRHNGEQQGATLTSFALTNRPVLDELPPIQLSETAWREGDQEMKKEERPLCPAPEHHNKQPMYCPICDKDMLKQAAPHLSEAHTTTVLQLSEVRDKDGRIDLSVMREGMAISMETYRAWEAQCVVLSELQQAVNKGIVLPAQRPYFEKIALRDAELFRSLVSGMKPQVDLAEHGIGGDTTFSGVSAEVAHLEGIIHQLAADRAKTAGVDHVQALKLIASERRDLFERRRLLTREVTA